MKKSRPQSVVPKVVARASVITAQASTNASRQSMARGKHNPEKLAQELDAVFKEFTRVNNILTSATISH